MSIEKIVTSAKTIAIIGCSSNEYRTSYRIAKYLVDAGFAVIPINPNESSVLGRTSYPQIFDVPENIEIDLIVIFRNSRYTTQMVEEIVDWSKTSTQKPVVWTQIGVSSAEAKRMAEEHGFIYIEDRCVMVEHRKTG